jgi:nucleosome binding factor SPN SPT16 subunit
MERVAKHHRFHLEYHESTKISSQNISQIRFDIPYRDLGFHGVPNREMVLIQPTVRCLVNLTETPFFLVELDRVPNQSGKF